MYLSLSSKIKITTNNTKEEKIFNLKLSKQDQTDDVFGKVDIYKGEDSLTILKLKDLPDPPKGLEAKSTVGVLKTTKFYFLFPWEGCIENNKLDFSKLTGLLEVAHGTNEKKYFNLNPFTPPGNHKWKIHHLAPFGSILVVKVTTLNRSELLKSRIFSTSVIDFSQKPATGTHTLWDYSYEEVTTKHSEGVQTDDKYKNRKKFISGTTKEDNNNKIMDLELSKFEIGEDFKKKSFAKNDY